MQLFARLIVTDQNSMRGVLSLVQEVVGFRRPLVLLGQSRHSRQASFQNNAELIACGFERDFIDEAPNGLACSGEASILAFECVGRVR
jgi:hypothetical protein